MIEANGLTKYYGPVTAIRDVSFEVKQGEVVGFLGPNGAGKSTTMRILTCYMPPSTGIARVAGMDCFEQSLQVRKKIGYLPENVPLYRDLTIKRFLRFAADAKGVPAKKVSQEIQRALAVCGLDKTANRIIGHLSKGYRQRVGLAQALLNSPEVLILDEPTIGLDPTQIIEIRRLIQELAGEHTILLSSHILPEVAQLCQRVIIINKGQIITSDTPANLTSQLQKSSRICLQVKGNLPELADILRNMAGVQTVSLPSDDGERIVIETDRSSDLRAEIARMVMQRGMDLLELKLMDLSLEEIFMQLVTEEPME
ncbi:MAG TPA: MFS transporter [Syntrophobacteraceae bacterium]|nr:MFS transporter [Syntrophobacteraceae bacterium]